MPKSIFGIRNFGMAVLKVVGGPVMLPNYGVPKRKSGELLKTGMPNRMYERWGQLGPAGAACGTAFCIFLFTACGMTFFKKRSHVRFKAVNVVTENQKDM